LNESFEVSPANPIMSLAGASSLLCSAVFALEMPWTTFQRHDSIGN
jgi:hypothetical protein